MLLPDLSKEPFLVVDCETHDPGLKEYGTNAIHRNRGGCLLGYSVWVPSGFNQYYIHEKDSPSARWLQDQIRKTPLLVNAHTKYDLLWLMSEGIWTPDLANRPVGDILINANLLNENKIHSVNSLLEQYGLPVKKEERLIEECRALGLPEKKYKEYMDCYSVEAVAEYANWDTAGTGQVWIKQQTELKAEGLERVQALEQDLLPILALMEAQGIRLDVDSIPELEEELEQQIQVLCDDIINMTGLNLGFSPTDKLRNWCGENVPNLRKTAGGKYAVGDKDLTGFEGHPVLGKIIQARKLDKIRGTYLNGYFKDLRIKDRVYPNINQVRGEFGGTESGRMSYSKPNMQNIPAKAAIWSPKLRGLVLADEGHKLISSDYSQQEPRWMVHYAATWGLPGAQEVADYYRLNPNEDWHGGMSKAAGISRAAAKILVLGRAYLGGLAGLHSQMPSGSITRADCDLAVGAMDARLPWLRQAGLSAKAFADKESYARTWAGRKSRFDQYEPAVFFKSTEDRKEFVKKYGSATATSKERALELWLQKGVKIRRAYTKDAFNRIIQGSAADHTKTAMVKLYKEYGLVALLQIHDQLAGNVKNKEEEQAYVEAMETAIELKVPIKVDYTVTDRWVK